MTRDDVIRVAREAGIETVLPAPNGQVEALSDFAELVAAAEREECAQVCEEGGLLWGQRYAAAIRASGE